jgi:hypothetical protein
MLTRRPIPTTTATQRPAISHTGRAMVMDSTANGRASIPNPITETTASGAVMEEVITKKERIRVFI